MDKYGRLEDLLTRILLLAKHHKVFLKQIVNMHFSSCILIYSQRRCKIVGESDEIYPRDTILIYGLKYALPGYLNWKKKRPPVAAGPDPH